MPINDVRIQPAQLEDLEPIIHLWEVMMAQHELSDDRIRLAEGAVPAYRAYVGYHMTNRDSRVLVARIERRMVGFALLTVAKNLPMFLPAYYGYLSDLAVVEDARRMGVGRRLMREMADWLRERGIETVQLQYYTFNVAGAEFWASLGFKPYYTRAWLDIE